MSIDWFTVIAQAVNFIVLLWLLKRFLYKPVLHAIDEREKRIAEKLDKAETQQTMAQRQKDEYDRKNQDLKHQIDNLLEKAQEDGQKEKLQLLQEAREEADALSSKRREALVLEEKALHKEIRRRIQHEVIDLTRKVLRDLAGANLEEQMVGVFISRLGSMSDEEIQFLNSSLESPPGKISLQTAFELSSDLQASIEASIKKMVRTKPKITFDIAPEIVNGIELTTNGQKVAWSVSDYLSSFAEKMEDLLQRQGR